MTDDRLTQATGVAIELLRGASQIEDVAEAVLERLAHAARGQRTGSWIRKHEHCDQSRAGMGSDPKDTRLIGKRA